MDVSITPGDKQSHEAFIKTHDDKQAIKYLRAQKRKDRKLARADIVVERRLRRRIKRQVRRHLLEEKRNYLRGGPNNGSYVIITKIIYKKISWYYTISFIEEILNENLSRHTGFEYTVNSDTYYKERKYCRSICITYTLLEQ